MFVVVCFLTFRCLHQELQHTTMRRYLLLDSFTKRELGLDGMHVCLSLTSDADFAVLPKHHVDLQNSLSNGLLNPRTCRIKPFHCTLTGLKTCLRLTPMLIFYSLFLS